MRSRSLESGSNVQSDTGRKYNDGSLDGANGALVTVTRIKPLRELGKDETGFYPLDE